MQKHRSILSGGKTYIFAAADFTTVNIQAA
jgi:hypothetical protein